MHSDRARGGERSVCTMPYLMALQVRMWVSHTEKCWVNRCEDQALFLVFFFFFFFFLCFFFFVVVVVYVQHCIHIYQIQSMIFYILFS